MRKLLIAAQALTVLAPAFIAVGSVKTAVHSETAIKNEASAKLIAEADVCDIADAVSAEVSFAEEPEADSSERVKEVMLDVPFFTQEEYPTGCELVSTSMILAHYGFDISAGELVNGGFVETKDIYFDHRGVAYGGDPNRVFIGSPFDENGYGCFSGTIIAALEKILPQEEYEILDLGGKSLDSVCREYIDEGIPVLVWASIDMQPTYQTDFNIWTIDDTGEVFNWISKEHCLVLVGYDDGAYIFNDPLAEKGGISYKKSLVESRYAELGRQAVAVRKRSRSSATD